MTAANIVRYVVIAIGVLIFIGAEFVEQANQRKPAATGARRIDQFNRDAGVFGLRIAGALIVVFTLVQWEIANRFHPH